MSAVIVMVRGMDASGGPSFPNATVRLEADGVYTVTNGTQLVHVYKAGVNGAGTLGLFFVCGPRALLTAWASSSDFAWTLTELRADNTANANSIKRRLPYWRINGTDSAGVNGPITITDQVRQLVTPLPATAPTVAAPWVMGTLTVTQLIRPVMPRTVFGFDYVGDAESTV